MTFLLLYFGGDLIPNLGGRRTLKLSLARCHREEECVDMMSSIVFPSSQTTPKLYQIESNFQRIMQPPKQQLVFKNDQEMVAFYNQLDKYRLSTCTLAWMEHKKKESERRHWNTLPNEQREWMKMSISSKGKAVSSTLFLFDTVQERVECSLTFKRDPNYKSLLISIPGATKSWNWNRKRGKGGKSRSSTISKSDSHNT